MRPSLFNVTSCFSLQETTMLPQILVPEGHGEVHVYPPPQGFTISYMTHNSIRSFSILFAHAYAFYIKK